MKNKNLVLLFLLLMVEGGLLSAAAQSKSSVYKPWSHGQLKVSKENIFTDQELYEEYNLTDEEINIIESVIKERK